ncbi:MAG: DNA polymerase III subunit delta [Candidatus Nealsonbacteria bacterium CG09_land_8_20_14_0_10_42_14]|uniref:DNA polymerase III subunit delta n=1 Tax=Candidatus Nealsonbacteria bacterium CG09_land_8_20_14_0_10_42_14 TaxID=1974707 RepID=A0A2H0X016_9BACT|nr:MAG: DNA polymerase III subunit delta [Candidatus Nealsonbacteria bacterium CG09_land_8_20_14_0_10_42_14]
MLIFLYGPDSYRSRQKLKEIVEHYEETHKSGLNLRYLDGKNLDYADFKNEIQITSMFKEKKLLILTDVFSNQEFKDNFLKNSKKLINSEDVVLFYETKEIPKNNSLFSFLKKQAKSQEFQLLSGQKLRNWVKKELAEYSAAADSATVEKLIEYVGSDLWGLSNEIRKLASYKNKGKIETKDVELLTRSKTETDIFKTIDAIASKNKKQALRLIHKHLEKGDAPLYLLSMITFQFRNILLVKDLLEKGKSLKLSQLHPYVISKTYGLAQRFAFGDLKKIYRNIFQVDYNIKTGKSDPQTALDLFIAEI